MSEYAISVKDLSIKYRCIRPYSIKRNLLHMKKAEVEEFEALKGITFDVTKGEIIGIIGKNGSGKSTLLRALAGIFAPDNGTIELYNNSISLLSIGVGFQRKLSGRENIYLSGMLLGFSVLEIDERIDQIIEFAELGDFIDRPVKTYSSGMYSKLAFSITAILETDIILIDEVLSVGDAKFKNKSYGKMKELISDQDRTVVLVSHSNETLKELCDTILWIHDGEVRMCDTPDKVLPLYMEFMS